MKKYITKQSSIKGAGKGLFTNAFFKKGEVIGLAHVDDQPASEIGRNHNHNEKNPTAYSKKINNKRFIYASRNLKPGEEITTNYRMQPELEQPEDFMRKGGALLTKKVTCKSCGWKWDAEDGGNDITTCHKCGGQGLVHAQDGGPISPEEWGQQIKDIERQIGNPSDWTLSDYNTLQNKLNEYKSWRKNTPEGQAVIDSHNEEGEYDIPLPEHLQDYTNAMMKARLAYANEFSNPAAERMINLPDNPYQFDNGDTGSHYMASMDNYAVPQIQDENGVLQLGDYGPESNEAIRFDSDEDANYFAENYKDVSPGFINEKQYGGISNDYIEVDLDEDEIEEYRRGGYIVEEIDTYQNGGTVYTVKGSNGYYKKVNGKWQVDWNKSGKYQPLSKGDVKARTAVLDKMAKPVDNGISKISSNSSDNTRVNYQKPLVESFNRSNNLESFYKKEREKDLQRQKDATAYHDKTQKVKQNQSFGEFLNQDVLGIPTYEEQIDQVTNDKKLLKKELKPYFETEKELDKFINQQYSRPTASAENNWNDGPIQMVYPEKYFIGPSGGMIGNIKNLGKNTFNLGKKVLSNPYVLGGLNAYFGTEGIKEFLNPNSLTRKSMSRAYDDPTGSNIGDAAFDVGMNSLNFIGLPFNKAFKGLKKYSKPIVKYANNKYTNIAEGSNMFDYAWKSPAARFDKKALRTYTEAGDIIAPEMPQSAALFDKLKTNPNLTAEELAIIKDYEATSIKYKTGPNKEKLDAIIKKSGLILDEPTVMSRRINTTRTDNFNPVNGIFNTKRPTSWSAGRDAVGNMAYSGSADRMVMKLQPGEYNMLKNPYLENSPETLNALTKMYEPMGSLEHRMQFVTGNPRIAEREILLGSGTDLKQIGKVKNNFGGFDYIMKNLNKKQDGGASNDYVELDLTPEEIQVYKNGGYIVEEIDTYQKGGVNKKGKSYDYTRDPTYTERFKRFFGMEDVDDIAYEKVDDKNIKKYKQTTEPIKKTIRKIPTIETKSNFELDLKNRLQNIAKENILKEKNISKVEPIKNSLQITKNNNSNIKNKIVKPEDSFFESTYKEIKSFDNRLDNQKKLFKNGLNRKLQTWGIVETKDKKVIESPEPINVKDYYKNPTLSQTILNVNDQPNRQFKQQTVPTSNLVLGSRNRGQYQDIESDGLEFTTFHPFNKAVNIKPYNKKTNVNGINDDNSVFALDNKGVLHTGIYKNLKNNKDWKFSRTFMNKIVSIDDISLDGARSGNPKFWQPQITILENNKLKKGALNILTKKGKAEEDYYGSILGGRVVFVNPLTKEQTLVSGSVSHIKKEFKRLKGNSKYLEAWSLDNGTYARGLSYKDGKLTKQRLINYDAENTSGGNGLYIKKYNVPVNKFKETYVYDMPNVRTKKDDSYKAGHKLKNEIKNFVLHHTAYDNPITNEAEVKKQFMTPGQNSSHVVIEEDGSRTIYASPEQVSFHAGKSKWNGREDVNDFSIGVEFQGDTQKKPLTDQQVISFVEYYVPIAKKYNLNLKSIITHEQIRNAYIKKHANEKGLETKPDITYNQYKRILNYMKAKGIN